MNIDEPKELPVEVRSFREAVPADSQPEGR